MGDLDDISTWYKIQGNMEMKNYIKATKQFTSTSEHKATTGTKSHKILIPANTIMVFDNTALFYIFLETKINISRDLDIL